MERGTSIRGKLGEAVLGMFLLLALPAHAADRVHAIDGDTIRIGRETIRIASIDAPETGSRAKCESERRLGEAAKRRLAALVASGPVQVTRGDPADGRTFDRYGRTLGTVTVNGRDVGDVLVAEGLAREWTGRRQPWCR